MTREQIFNYIFEYMRVGVNEIRLHGSNFQVDVTIDEIRIGKDRVFNEDENFSIDLRAIEKIQVLK